MALGVEITIVRGEAEFRRSFRRFTEQVGVTERLGQGLSREAYGILGESLPLAPIDTGFMRQTAHVKTPEVAGDVVQVPFGYGAEYAIFVHEDLEARHAPGTQAKFLETPFLAWKATGAERVAALVRDAFLEAV